jgi:dienelactone hydrolase
VEPWRQGRKDGPQQRCQGQDTAGQAELFVYSGSAHLFMDSSLSDYDEKAAAQLTERVLDFLQNVR